MKTKTFLLLLAILGMGLGLKLEAQTMDPAAAAKKLFADYKPKIEQSKDAVCEEPVATVGDLNGDGREDCILSFLLYPKNGGNAVIGHESAVYLNTGKAMKVVGAFPKLDYCYQISGIEKGLIVLLGVECAPPYDKQTGKIYRYRWQHGKLEAVR